MRETVFRTPVDILLVEDDPAHVALLRRILGQSRRRITMEVVDNGADALRFLRREPPFEQARRPRLVLLDLFLPGLPGTEVLTAIRRDPFLRVIPVVVLTASTRQQDILAAYDEGARAFISKPSDHDAFENVVRTIDAFWLETAQLPVD